MAHFLTLTKIEITKILKSKIFVISVVCILLLPIIDAMFMLISLNPEVAKNAGVIAEKAKIVEQADWPSYLGFLTQMISIGGVILFGFFASWVFGREYSDKTIKDLLALPMPRVFTVIAKFFAFTLWCLFLSALAFVVAILLGQLINLDGFSLLVLLSNFETYFICALMVISLGTPIALLANIGKGYLPPLGLLFFALFVGQILGALGHGAYFPWVIPGLYSGINGAEILPTISYIILVATSLIGILLTSLWWRFADQH